MDFNTIAPAAFTRLLVYSRHNGRSFCLSLPGLCVFTLDCGKPRDRAVFHRQTTVSGTKSVGQFGSNGAFFATITTTYAALAAAKADYNHTATPTAPAKTTASAEANAACTTATPADAATEASRTTTKAANAASKATRTTTTPTDAATKTTSAAATPAHAITNAKAARGTPATPRTTTHAFSHGRRKL